VYSRFSGTQAPIRSAVADGDKMWITSGSPSMLLHGNAGLPRRGYFATSSAIACIGKIVVTAFRRADERQRTASRLSDAVG
jgi:hypothetical protein